MLNSSLPGHAGVAAIVYVVLSAIAVVVIDLRLVLIPTAGTVLGLIVGGFVIFRPLRTGVVVAWPAQSDPENQQVVIVINGQPCPFQGYEQDLVVAVRVRRLAELFSCCLLSGGALYFMFSAHGTGETVSQIGGFEAEIICICGLVILLTSLRWFTERRFLRRSRIALGSILAMDPGFFRQGLTYQFFDQQGDRRGGKGPLIKPNDNAVLVLYWPSDADVNTAHGSFAFHDFSVGLLPGRRKVGVDAGAQS
jgi:hypothetical protein